MKLRSYISAFILTVLICSPARGQQPESDRPLIRFGLEWGYTPTFASLYHYNYISDEGYRINDSDSGFTYSTNGNLLVHVGVNATRKLSISAISGITGLTKGVRVFPALLRFSYYFKGVCSDGMFTYLDGGAGFHPAKPGTPPRNSAWIADIGGGYRIALSREISLDLLSSLRWAYDHSLIPNPDAPGWIQPQNIRRDNAGYFALSLSIGLTF